MKTYEQATSESERVADGIRHYRADQRSKGRELTYAQAWDEVLSFQKGADMHTRNMVDHTKHHDALEQRIDQYVQEQARAGRMISRTKAFDELEQQEPELVRAYAEEARERHFLRGR